MPFNPNEFFKLAQKMLSDTKYDNEPGWRTVINRCYYGVFLQIRESLKAELLKVDEELFDAFNKEYTRGKMHSLIKNILKSINPKTGTFFAKVQKSRRKSDYDLSISVTKNEAEEAIALASIILKSIKTDLSKITHKRIRNKIQRILLH